MDISDIGIYKAKYICLSAKTNDFMNQIMQFDDNTFSIVVMLDVLEHLYQLKEILKEARKITKKYLTISIQCFNSFQQEFKCF